MKSEEPLTPIAARQLQWFTSYVRFYLRRNFHGLHLLRLTELDDLDGLPILVCLNHPSWWDPLIALYLSQRFFPQRSHRGPIAQQGLAKYRFFERLGFFGIDGTTRSGAARFLRVSERTLRQPNSALWVTPQGAFVDVRKRPVQIEAGVGHLAHRLGQFAMLPLALEYSYWNERYPEGFACFGTPVVVASGAAQTAEEWRITFSEALERTQDILAERVQGRNPAAFESLVSGNAGVGGIYDLWRNLKARLQGKRWQPEHGSN